MILGAALSGAHRAYSKRARSHCRTGWFEFLQKPTPLRAVLQQRFPGLLSPILPGYANVNQRNSAAGIDNALLDGAALPTGFNALFALSGDPLLKALSLTSGEIATTASQAAFNALSQFLNTLTDPFAGG